MDIAEYLEHAGMSPETFAKLLGVHGGTVRRWLVGGTIKGQHIKTMIEATRGLITAEALLGLRKQRGLASAAVPETDDHQGDDR